MVRNNVISFPWTLVFLGVYWHHRGDTCQALKVVEYCSTFQMLQRLEEDVPYEQLLFGV